MRGFGPVLAAAFSCALTGAAATASPFTVDDLLHAETLGAAMFDPAGRRLVYEQRDAYDTAARFDYDQSVALALSRLRVVDLAHPGPGRPLLAGDPAGVVMGPFSPSGARLAVFRAQGDSWRLAVVTLGDGSVHSFGLTPQGDSHGRTVQWRDDRTLLVIDRPDGRTPLALHQGAIMARTLPRFWAAAADGAGAHTAYGSGAYLGVRGRGPANRLLQLDVVSGQETVLAEGQFIDLELSPQGDEVALLESGADLQPQGDAPVRGPAGSETEASILSRLDLRTGVRTSPCPGWDVLPQLLSWSPSGRRLLLFGRRSGELWTQGRLLLMGVGTGCSSVGRDVRPHLDFNPATVWTAWLGETPLVFGRLADAEGERDDWFAVSASGARNLTADLPPPSGTARLGGVGGFKVVAGGTLWRIDAAGRKAPLATPATAVTWPDLRFGAGMRLDRATPPRLWIAARDGSGDLQLEGFGGAGGPPVRAEVTDTTDVADAAAGVVLQRTTDAHGVETLALKVGGRIIPTTAVNLGREARDPPQIVSVRHPGPAGEPLVSWVVLPRGSPANARLPLIVRPYPGASYRAPPLDTPGRLEFYQNLRVLTGRGYAVLVPSLPNPPEGMIEPANGLADRVLAIVRAALDTPELAGRLDPARMAIMGHSFGGYAAMTAISQTDCFRAAVAMNGVSDLTAYWASLPAHLQLDSELAYWSNWHTGVVERTQPELQVPPWRDPARYVRNSPLYAADRIHTPLLLIHGGQDGLSLAQSEAMYSALFRQGKDALLLVYWGAMHAPSAPGDIRDVYAQTFRFLDEHLGPPVSGGAAPPASPTSASASGGPTPPSPPPTGCPRASPSR